MNSGISTEMGEKNAIPTVYIKWTYVTFGVVCYNRRRPVSNLKTIIVRTESKTNKKKEFDNKREKEG